MFGKSIKLFRVGGIDIRLDPSWFILVLLITWSLAMGLFPLQFPTLSPGTWWAMGFAGAIGLFLSILIHEISHSIVGRRFGLEMQSITLFLFGGMAEMPHEPARPRAEFWMSIAGPIASLVLSAVFYAIDRVGLMAGWSLPWIGIFGYLSLVNLLLAVFNLVPAFPLDGGRVLRSILWASTGDYGASTRIATRVGAGFGLLLVLLGAVRILTGNVVGGVWWMLIGIFIRTSAQASLQHLAISRLLSHEYVRDLMNPHPITVTPEMPVHKLVDDFLYKYDYRVFPVTDGDRLVGCVGLSQVKGLSREAWDTKRVGEVMQPCSKENTVSPGIEAEKALKRMAETGASPLLVTENGKLEGIVSARDLVHQLSVRMELDKPFSGPIPAHA
ncbi:MAG: putative zinc metalloprotease containing domain pair [Fibrobacteres bacterium]|nr:putative zinc metalloprotease containing domain pair [Fibrobacterota bacterium]